MSTKKEKPVVILERDIKTEFAMFQQLCSLKQCWVCLREWNNCFNSDSLNNNEFHKTKLLRKVMKRLIKRELSFQPFLFLMKNKLTEPEFAQNFDIHPEEEDGMVNVLIRNCCAECGPELQTLLKLEVELEQLMEHINQSLNILVQKRKCSFAQKSEMDIPASTTVPEKENSSASLVDTSTSGLIPPAKVKAEVETPLNSIKEENWPVIIPELEDTTSQDLNLEEFAPPKEDCGSASGWSPQQTEEDDDYVPEENGQDDPDSETVQSGSESEANSTSSNVKTLKRRRKCPEIQDPNNIVRPQTEQSGSESEASSTITTVKAPKKRRKYQRLSYPKIQDPNNIVCPDCPGTPKKFARLDNFRLHYKKVHLGHHETFPCPYCDKTFTYKISLRSHVTKRHPEQVETEEAQEKSGIKPTPFKPLDCPKCSRKLFSKTAWIEHVTMQCEIPPDSLPFKVETFVCEFPGCEAKFYTKRRFDGHVLTHKKVRPFSCPQNCGKKFSRKFTMKIHIDRHCPNSSKPKVRKRSGKTAPSGDVPVFTCPHCARDFVQNSCFKKHVKLCFQNLEDNKSKAAEAAGVEQETDLDPRKGFCDICGKVLLRVEIPRHKERVHEKVRRWVCEICGKSFYAKFGLESHVESVHENRKSKYSKPGLCDLCGKDFRDSRNLSDHKLRVHYKVTRYRCQVCSKGFYHKNDFRKHFKSHNKEEDMDMEEIISDAKVVEK